MTAMTTRAILLVAHTGRAAAVTVARQLAGRFCQAGITVHVLDTEADELACDGVVSVGSGEADRAEHELLLAVGGDGTLLRAAETARSSGTPLLGINLGHVGFLAEADRVDLDLTVDRVLSRDYDVEDRLTLSVVVHRDDRPVIQDWALNDVSVEKAARERMLDVVLEIDDRPLSRWGCDGIVCATPTGSTAYAFSAGGPVIWPGVQALLVVPLSAHALFARPLVVAPESMVAVELAGRASSGVMFCDGRRTHDLAPGDRLEVSRSDRPVRLVRLRKAPFTDRLVDKFQLPVQGWRGRPEE